MTDDPYKDVDFSAVNRKAPGYRSYVERLHREGDPFADRFDNIGNYRGAPPNLTIGHAHGLGAAGAMPIHRSLDVSIENYSKTAARPLLIALSSPAMGSGKSTVADHLVRQHGFVPLKFAAPLKAMTRSLLAELGMDSEEIQARVEGPLKEEPIPALQVTCRQVQQRLGTEFGRKQLHEDVWADITVSKAKRLLEAGQSVVIDDMRYRNEHSGVIAAGGTAIRIVRPGAVVTSSHSSEGELDNVPMIDLHNNGTVEQLTELADGVLAYLLDDQF